MPLKVVINYLTLALLSFVLLYQVVPQTDIVSSSWSTPLIAEFILLTNLVVIALLKSKDCRENLEPLFWILIATAFASWVVLDAIRYIFILQEININVGFIEDIRYFIFCVLMLSAIEVKSFSEVRKAVSWRNMITSFSLFSFLIGAFSYFILAPSESVKLQQTNNNSYFFYALVNSYLIIRWWHIAYQEKKSHRLSYLLFGFAHLAWLSLDFVHMNSNFEQIPLWQWLNLIPYLLIFAAIETNNSTKFDTNTTRYFRRYHIYNSPIFFLGMISIVVLFQNQYLDIEKSASVENTEIIWVFTMMLLAFVQVFELFETNKRRKLKIAHINESNSKILKELEERTKQLNHQVKSNQIILDSINNPIMTLRLSGEILTCNSATEQLLGYREADLIGRNFSELVPESEEFHHFFDYQSYRQQLLKNRQGLELESKLICFSGKEVIVHISLSQGQSFTRDKIIVSLTDIREQKKAEQHLHKLRDEFTANISHEFRTPLTIVNGIVDELMADSSLLRHLPTLEVAKRNNLRLIHMVDQLLELSRLNSESIKLSDLDASQWVEPLCLSYQTIAKDKDIDYHYAICKSIYIHGNQQAFEKILYNLLSNAFKYTPQGGSVNVSLEERETHYRLMVADNGIGISKREQSVIFDRFHRSGAISEQAIPGVGIGLALVKELVNAMGWQLNLTSAIKKGSQFVVEIRKAKNIEKLPQATEAEPHKDSQIELLEEEVKNRESTEARKKSKYMVLIIEDNFDMQRHLENIISSHHQCLVAANGNQGLSMAEEFLPDLIICDVMMPDIDGFEVLTKLKQQPITAHIPIVMLTAKTDRKSKLKGLRNEADDYLGKPFDAEELLLKLNNQINLRKKLQQKYESQWQGIVQVEHDPVNDIPENDFLLLLNQQFEKNYTDPNLSMSKLAAKLAMSDRQLQRKVKALVDINPLELLKRFRLEKAKLQLRQNKQIGLVAQSCGFSSQTYFGRCFKEHFGITPKMYQQS